VGDRAGPAGAGALDGCGELRSRLGVHALLAFILATILGTVPLLILVALLSADPGRLKTGLIAVSTVSLVTFVVYLFWERRRR
jgi:hypothetical protein